MRLKITMLVLSLFMSAYAIARDYYVSALIGKDSNPGTEAAPYLTIQKAADLTNPGERVFVMNGTYAQNNWAVVTINRSGTENSYITYTNYPGHSPIIKVDQWHGFIINSNASYIKINGLTFEGNSATLNLAEAKAQPGSCEGPNPGGAPQSKWNGNGITVDGRNLGTNHPHHIIISSNTVHHCPGAGIAVMEADYITIDNNTVYNNSWYTVYGASGISLFHPWNYDSNSGYRNYIRNNKSFGNILFVKWAGPCQITDGNGIILDDFLNTQSSSSIRGQVYTGRTLVANNIVADNGGSGIHSYICTKIDIINNTAYKNSRSAETVGEIYAQESNDIRLYNNIIYAETNQAANGNYKNTNVIYNYNLYYNTTNIPAKGANDVIGDPKFVSGGTNIFTANFQLQGTSPASPAINAGSNIAGQYYPTDFLGIARPQGTRPDMGAYESQVIPGVITTGTLSGTSYCSGSSVAVPFTITGTFNSGNVFTAQLSNATGSFTTPVNIGTLTGTSSGTISATIPGGTATGTAYRIRVVGSNPSVTGSNNGTNLAINSSVTPTVSISASATTICAGTNVTFTATPTNGGTTPAYQWKKNGSNVGTNAATYASTTLVNGDIITNVLTSNATCATQSTVSSNNVTMTVNPTVIPSVTIAASATSICTGTNVTFTATPTNGGTTPSYQWKVNGVNVGTNATTFASSTLANGDVVTSTLTSNATCASSTTATSAGIAMAVTSGCGIGLSARYYDNINFTGTVVERVDPTVNFTWASAASPASGISGSSYSVIWDGYIKPQYAGTYTFYTTADDGIRLWVNSQLVIDNWIDQAPTEKSGTISLNAGQSYIIQIQYYNNTLGGTAKLSWSHAQVTKEIVPQQYLFPSGDGFGLWTTYYNNIDFTGTQVNRMEPTVNFSWGAGSPDGTIDAETFSARWSGQVKPNLTEAYTFYTYSDDGVRLWVNNVQLINNWTNHGPTENSGTISLIAGQKYNIVMEYYENTGGATAQLSWSSAGQAKQIIPSINLYPSSGGTFRSAIESIAEETFDNTISAYPNPTKDLLNVTFYSENETDASVELMTTMSQVVSRKSLRAFKGNNITIIDVRGLDEGMYLLNVKSGSHKSVKKIIITK